MRKLSTHKILGNITLKKKIVGLLTNQAQIYLKKKKKGKTSMIFYINTKILLG